MTVEDGNTVRSADEARISLLVDRNGARSERPASRARGGNAPAGMPKSSASSSVDGDRATPFSMGTCEGVVPTVPSNVIPCGGSDRKREGWSPSGGGRRPPAENNAWRGSAWRGDGVTLGASSPSRVREGKGVVSAVAFIAIASSSACRVCAARDSVGEVDRAISLVECNAFASGVRCRNAAECLSSRSTACEGKGMVPATASISIVPVAVSMLIAVSSDAKLDP